MQLWTYCAPAPVAVIEHVRIYIQKSSERTNTSNNYCAPNFFFSLPTHLNLFLLISEAGRRSQLASSAGHCLLAWYSGIIMVDYLTSPVVPDHSLAKSLQGEQHDSVQKITLLHWGHLVSSGPKRCSYTVQPVQQVVRVGAITIHLPPRGPSPFRPSSCPSAPPRGAASNDPSAGKAVHDPTYGGCPCSLCMIVKGAQHVQGDGLSMGHNLLSLWWESPSQTSRQCHRSETRMVSSWQ